MKRLHILGATIMSLALISVGLLACGGDGDGNGEVPAEEKTPAEETTTADAEAQQAADAAVLMIEDLPTGWVETEPSEEGADPCDTRRLVREKEIARAVSMNFEKDDGFLRNLVSVFPDADTADEVVTAVRDRLVACDPEDFLESLSEDEPPEDVTFEDAEIGRLSFPSLADRTEALRLTVTMSGESAFGGEMTVDVPYDFVFIRSGRMLSIVVTAELLSFGDGLSQEMAELSAEKLERAAAQLTRRPVATAVEATPAADTARTVAPTRTQVPPTPTEPPAPTGRSRADPIPRGVPLVEPEGWEITVLDYVPDAWPTVQAENQFNDPPQPGYRMAMIRVRVKNVSADDPAYFSDGDLKLVGSENVVYTAFERSCGVIPGAFGFPELFRGGVIEGNVCFQVREQETSLVLFTDFSFGNKDRRYFAVE